jgi:hypothetical protein
MLDEASSSGMGTNGPQVLSGADDPDAATYNAFAGTVNTVNSGISGGDTGAGDWQAFTIVCNQAVNNSIGVYIQGCGTLDPNEDQDSWNAVKGAAASASGQDDHQALMTILNGFLGITQPSENFGAWSALHNNSYAWLNTIDPDPFRTLMRTVRQLNDGIIGGNTGSGDWEAFTMVCNGAVDSGIRTYIQGCAGLDPNEDQASWTAVKGAAVAASQEADDAAALTRIMLGFLVIGHPSNNNDAWDALRGMAIASLNDGSGVAFSGSDTRARRTLKDVDRLPNPMTVPYMIKKAGFPASYTETLGLFKTCHVEYFMRLDTTDPSRAAYFLITHSQDAGGYIGLAKVDGQYVGTGNQDHVVAVPNPPFAGEVVWWDHLDASHPGGCNHPGNGGQLSLETGGQFGPIAVIVGQDWTKSYLGHHVVDPVGNGSKALFYDFSVLNTGALPTMGGSGATTNAYLGCLTTEQLGLAPGDDGEVSSVNIEQGPDGMYYLIAGNANQTVLWRSSGLVPDISTWQQITISSVDPLNDGSSMLAWATFDDGQGPAGPFLYYVQSATDGMAFRQVQYMLIDGGIVALHVNDAAAFQTSQSDDFGDKDWVEDNGSLYAGAGGGVALHGTYQSIDDSKGPAGQEEPCVQVRAWYTP